MALAFAGRILGEPGLVNDEQRIGFAFRVALSREARPVEVEFLKQILSKRQEELASKPGAAGELVSAANGWKAPNGIDTRDLAKWFTVANVLLNLDEAITKG